MHSGARFAWIAVAASLVTGCASAGAGGGAAAPTAGAGGGAAAPMAATPELIAEGQQLFAQTCQACHGPGGMNGSLGPDLTDDEWLWVDPSSPTAMSDVMNVIRIGVATPSSPGGFGMPAMGGATFTDPQLNALAAYILSL